MDAYTTARFRSLFIVSDFWKVHGCFLAWTRWLVARVCMCMCIYLLCCARFTVMSGNLDGEISSVRVCKRKGFFWRLFLVYSYLTKICSLIFPYIPRDSDNSIHGKIHRWLIVLSIRKRCSRFMRWLTITLVHNSQLFYVWACQIFSLKIQGSNASWIQIWTWFLTILIVLGSGSLLHFSLLTFSDCFSRMPCLSNAW